MENNLRLLGVSGTNKIMAGELSRLARRASLGARLTTPQKQGVGGLSYPFDPELAALAVTYHRTCARVLWELYRSDAERLEPLYDDLKAQVAADTRGLLQGDMSLTVNAFGVDAFAAGERQVVGTVKNALVDGSRALGCNLRVDPEAPDLHVSVRRIGDAMSVAIDLAGRPMNQRGYRLSGGEAPVREDLAALLVMLARHDAKTELLLDPMAGTGTIAVEAASLGRARPVCISPRVPAASQLPMFSAIMDERPKALFADTQPMAVANELSASAHELCVRHAARGGVEDFVDCRQGDFRDLDPDGIRSLAAEKGKSAEAGLILSNPPYGERMDDPGLDTLYRDLGQFCRGFPGWRAGFLVANPRFERCFGGQPRIKKPLSNGPLRGYFLLYDL